MRIDEVREERYISQCPNETTVKLRKADRISLRANGAAGRGFPPGCPFFSQVKRMDTPIHYIQGCSVKKQYVKPEVRSRMIKPGDIEAGTRFAQRRSVPRYPFAAFAIIVEPLTRTEISATTSDISLNGCYIESVDRFPQKTVVRVTIEQQAGESFQTWGRVAHVRAGVGTGIAFFEISAEQQLTLEKWVSEIGRICEGEQQ